MLMRNVQRNIRIMMCWSYFSAYLVPLSGFLDKIIAVLFWHWIQLAFTSDSQQENNSGRLNAERGYSFTSDPQQKN